MELFSCRILGTRGEMMRRTRSFLPPDAPLVFLAGALEDESLGGLLAATPCTCVAVRE